MITFKWWYSHKFYCNLKHVMLSESLSILWAGTGRIWFWSSVAGCYSCIWWTIRMSSKRNQDWKLSGFLEFTTTSLTVGLLAWSILVSSTPLLAGGVAVVPNTPTRCRRAFWGEEGTGEHPGQCCFSLALMHASGLISAYFHRSKRRERVSWCYCWS